MSFDKQNIKKWIKRLEVRLEFAGVKSQWLKRLCLENMLPQDIANSCNDLFGKAKTEADANIYKLCKARIMKVYGPKPKEDFKKAKSIVLVGLPSEAAKDIRDLICQKKPQLKECCCAVAVATYWEDILPSAVRASIAGMDLQNDFEFAQYTV